MEELAQWEQELQDSFDSSAEPCDEISRLPDGTMRFQVTFRISKTNGQALRQAAERMHMEIADYLLWCHQTVAQIKPGDMLLKTAFGEDYESVLGMVEATVLGARE